MLIKRRLRCSRISHSHCDHRQRFTRWKMTRWWSKMKTSKLIIKKKKWNLYVNIFLSSSLRISLLFSFVFGVCNQYPFNVKKKLLLLLVPQRNETKQRNKKKSTKRNRKNKNTLKRDKKIMRKIAICSSWLKVIVGALRQGDHINSELLAFRVYRRFVVRLEHISFARKFFACDFFFLFFSI